MTEIEEKINQILMNQSTIMVTLASLYSNYSNEDDDVEVLNQLLKNRHQEIKNLLIKESEAKE